MSRRLSFAVLLVLVAVAGILSWRLLPRGPRFGGAESRPALATSEQAEVSSAWTDDLKQLGWNRLRGSNGTGISTDTTIPLTWSESENLLWKTVLPGPGGSSPVLTEDYVFVTSYSGYAVEKYPPGDISKLQRHLSCLDRSSGKILWTKTVAAVQPESAYKGNGLPEHGYATNTPVTDGKSVFAFFGKSGVYAYDLDGNQLWERSVGEGLNQRGWGSCSSLITFNDLVIVNAAEEASALIALDKQTGEEVWRAESPRLPMSFTTPALVAVDENRTDLVIAVVGEVWGLNPATGQLLWYCESPIGGNVSPVTIVDQNLVYCFGGYQDEGCLCVEAGGQGDVTDTHVRWTSSETSYISSPVLHKSVLYWVGDDRIFYALDAETGELIEKTRVPSTLGGGKVTYASPVLINDNIFLQTRARGVVVFPASPDFELLAQNIWENDKSVSNATPAVDRGQLFLRTDTALYCVGTSNQAALNADENASQ